MNAKRINAIRDKLDAPSWRLSCGCCDRFDLREMLREQTIAREATEEIAVLSQELPENLQLSAEDLAWPRRIYKPRHEQRRWMAAAQRVIAQE